MQQTELKKSSSSLENNPNKIQQLWLMQNEIKQKIQNEKINKKCIVLVGDTNVGKTTLLYYLSGKKLNLVQNTAKKTKQIQPQVVYLDAKVSNSLSTTQVPNIFSQITDLSQLSLIDMPGLNDKRFMNVLSNMFTFSEVFEKLSKTSKVHIAFVISQEMFDSQQIKENLQQFVSRFNMKSIKKTNNISIIFTKTQDDEQSVKQKFIEFLQQIKEELQDDEQQKEVREIVGILLQLHEEDNTFFIFPKEDPVQTHGLEVTQTILERHAFIDVEQVLLHENFFGNVIQNQKIKITSFQETLTEVINQSYEQLSQFLELSVELTRILHKNLSPEIFGLETDFRTQLQNTYWKLQTYQKTSNTEQDLFNFSKFQESIIFICENISQNKEIFLLDRQIKELFTKLSSYQENNQLNEPQSNFVNITTQLLRNCIDKVTNVVSNFKQSESFIQPLKRIMNFLNWLSQKWYSNLNNVKSLDKISKVFLQNNKQLRKKISLKWKEISESNAFFEILNNFSQRSLQSQSESESQQEQPLHFQQKIQDNGYYGHTVKELKQKYTKVSQLPNLDDSKIQIQKILDQQRQLQQKIKKVVQILESQVIAQVKKAEHSRKYKITINPQIIAFILFQMRKLRHRIFLQSAINNFGYYLKFIYYSLVSESEKHKLMEILTGFVENLCIILDQYSLFQEEILLMLFVHGYSKIGKVFERGIRTGRIGQQFIRKQLIPHLNMLIQGTQCVKDVEQFSNIIIMTFNYLISQHSSSRSQSNQYKNKMDSMLSKLEQKIDLVSKTESNISTHGTELKSNKSLLSTKQPNYFVLVNNPSFDFSTIVQKVDILQKRNFSLQTYQIYHHFHKKSSLNCQQSTGKSHQCVKSS